LAQFLDARWEYINGFFGQIDTSLSIPQEARDRDRALEINTHSTVEATRIARLSHYRFIAKTDISRFYHSIYTHSVPWAFHGKAAAKADRDANSETTYFNRADHILRHGQDGQTVGIPVGPDTSRVIAEIVAAAIDLEFKRRCDVKDITMIRHVDDVWIGAHSHADVERALWRYREAMREFELDINENKTRIHSSDFRFADTWPSELAIALEAALQSTSPQKPERLRAALERAFAMAVADGDDGVLKYAIRYLDRHSDSWNDWEIGEPFLKRSIVHFGHTTDYVARVVVWRQFAKGDLDMKTWSAIFSTIIDSHGRIGNDSEVCWATYACTQLGIPIGSTAAENIIRNCGALSILSVLNCVEKGLADKSIFDAAYERMRLESAHGAFWPVLMEWKSRKWPKHELLGVNSDIIAGLSAREAILFDIKKPPAVFAEVEASNFDEVERAIEDRPSMYDDDDEPDEDEDNDF
ncbi:MAG TPA: RNA-directed DNA polymerase, partial [Steroidobacteraceae bacterium]|nr:RNA-directed DNA polymerase [Steroidobacteraceae bacterium]